VTIILFILIILTMQYKFGMSYINDEGDIIVP
jgi:hypothetical protein